MYKAEDLDAVWVCIPPYAHGGEVEEAAARGIHVFVEKPIALSLDVAEKMEAAVQRAGVVSWVGYHMRQAFSVRRVKALLEEMGGRVGLVVGRWWGSIVGGPGHWWWSADKGGGQLVEQATHIYDLARFLAGDVVQVYAELGREMYGDMEGFTIEDASAAVMRFRSGAVGVITATCGAKRGGYRVEMDVFARDLQAHIEGTERAIIYMNDAMFNIESRNDPYFDEDYKFILAVQGRGESEVPLSEGVKTLRLTLAALEAAKKKKVIYLG